MHITTGDCAVATLRHAGIADEIIAWRDVLHEGPVRAGLTLEALSGERAAFIAQAGWAPLDEVCNRFQKRDQAFRRAGEAHEVVLWFEHDLYDQLQLIQVLDSLVALSPRRVTLVCEAEYLGTMAPARAAALYGVRREVGSKQFAEAQRAWAAFRAADPRGIQIEGAELPFLGAALRRLLEEYPWTTDGLSRLERAILDMLTTAALPFGQLFAKTREEPAFLGDTVLRWHLQRLESEGWLERCGERWALTGKRPQRRLPRWLGGVQMLPQARWRWDPGLLRLVEQ